MHFGQRSEKLNADIETARTATGRSGSQSGSSRALAPQPPTARSGRRLRANPHAARLSRTATRNRDLSTKAGCLSRLRRQEAAQTWRGCFRDPRIRSGALQGRSARYVRSRTTHTLLAHRARNRRRIAPSNVVWRVPGLLAHVLVSKYADHLPLYRQSAIYAREGVETRPLDTGRLGGRRQPEHYGLWSMS